MKIPLGDKEKRFLSEIDAMSASSLLDIGGRFGMLPDDSKISNEKWVELFRIELKKYLQKQLESGTLILEEDWNSVGD